MKVIPSKAGIQKYLISMDSRPAQAALSRKLKMTGLLLLFFTSYCSLAEEYCFTLAENFYEQLYCEIQAKGRGDELPAFRDFLRNDPTTQALLLKRPARKLGINVPMPKPQSVARPAPAAKPSGQNTAQIAGAMQGCDYSQGVIQCASNAFHFVKNLPNDQLAPGALTSNNKMAIPSFSAALTDGSAVGKYLANAYAIYLEKMMAIGLGAATMSYAKFHYFFYDISEKGISFSERFETLYHYLKKDKRALAIRHVSAPESLAPGECEPVTTGLLACSSGQRNYLFKQN